MKLGYTILYVASVADTLAFYERAFGLERGMVTETGEYGELRTGGTTLAFAADAFARVSRAFRSRPPPWTRQHRRSSLVL